MSSRSQDGSKTETMTELMSSRARSSGVRRPRRRWLRRLATGAGALVVAVLVLYGWAWLSLDRSSIARAILWMDSDVDDQHRFQGGRGASTRWGSTGSTSTWRPMPTPSSFASV